MTQPEQLGKYTLLERIGLGGMAEVWLARASGAGGFAKGRSQQDNVRAVLQDILGHGNEKCMLPGQPEAEAYKKSEQAGGLLFTAAEVDAFDAIAKEAGMTLDRSKLRPA